LHPFRKCLLLGCPLIIYNLFGCVRAITDFASNGGFPSSSLPEGIMYRVLAITFLAFGIAGCGSQGMPSQNGSPGLQNQETASATADAPPNMIVGIVNANGTVAGGTGFSSRRLAKGRYRLFAHHFGGCAAIFVTPTQNSAAFASGRQIGCSPRFNVLFAVFGSRLESGFQFMIIRVPT